MVSRCRCRSARVGRSAGAPLTAEHSLGYSLRGSSIAKGASVRSITCVCRLGLALLFGAAIGCGGSGSPTSAGTGGSGASGGRGVGSGGAGGALAGSGGTLGGAGKAGSDGSAGGPGTGGNGANGGGGVGNGGAGGALAGSGGTLGGAGKAGSDGSAGGAGTNTVGGCQNVQASCDLSTSTVVPSKGCIDDSGVPSATLSNLQTTCENADQGVWSSSPCDTSGSAGGCLIVGSGVCSIKWIPEAEVAGLSLATLQQECGAGTWVTPR
jgi:hypothetical protein